MCFYLKSFFSSLVLSGDWVVGDILNSKDLASEVCKSKFLQQHQLAKEWLEYLRPIERKEAAALTSSTQIFDFYKIEQEKKLLQEQLNAKQDNEQQLHKQLKAFVDELQEKEKILKQQFKEIEEKEKLKEKEIQERANTLYQQKVKKFFLNAHKVNHRYLSTSTQCNIETANRGTQVQEGIIFKELF